MRRALLREWPALSRRFPGLMPWHVGGPAELTVHELDVYVRAHQQMTRLEREQAAQQQQRR